MIIVEMVRGPSNSTKVSTRLSCLQVLKRVKEMVQGHDPCLRLQSGLEGYRANEASGKPTIIIQAGADARFLNDTSVTILTNTGAEVFNLNDLKAVFDG